MTPPVGRWHEAVPVREGLESIMDHDHGITLLWHAIRPARYAIEDPIKF